MAAMMSGNLSSNCLEKCDLSAVESVVIVDTFSTGALIASQLHRNGVKVVCVLSGDLKGLLDLIPADLDLEFAATIVYNDKIESDDAMSILLSQLHQLPFTISAVIAGAETGVELADRLSECLGLRTNGTNHSDARRNKFIMGETIRQSGIRAVNQILADSWDEVENWITEFNPIPFRIVVKPVESAGSDGVTLCSSVSEVKSAFESLQNSYNSLGVINDKVLIQEYLSGDEYVIDTISRDGMHKVTAVWVYDRRKVNNAGFVCFGQRLLTADEPHVRELIKYQKKVITALGIQNGPTHGEVKWCNDEPVLIEVGARCHGAEGAWMDICQRVYGYCQVYATVVAYLDESAFEALPDEPLVRYGYGRLSFFIQYENGICKAVNSEYLNEIKAMESFISLELSLKPGQAVRKTVDCFTFGGFMKLYSPCLDVVKRDYERLREIELSGGLYILEREEEEEQQCVRILSSL